MPYVLCEGEDDEIISGRKTPDVFLWLPVLRALRQFLLSQMPPGGFHLQGPWFLSDLPGAAHERGRGEPGGPCPARTDSHPEWVLTLPYPIRYPLGVRRVRPCALDLASRGHLGFASRRTCGEARACADATRGRYWPGTEELSLHPSRRLQPACRPPGRAQ